MALLSAKGILIFTAALVLNVAEHVARMQGVVTLLPATSRTATGQLAETGGARHHGKESKGP